ncbi:MAG: pilus assembly protein [Ruminococcus sp.]|nr:pilus assembly protein [Ruminococcus sp.]
MEDKMENKESDKKGFQGVITVEMSYLIPIVLLIFLFVIYTIFYYHDKNILIGAASETAVTGAQMERRPDKKSQVDMEEFYQQRIGGKLIFFSGTQVSVNISKKWVEIEAFASRRKMQIHIIQRAAITEPEKAIRRKRILDKITETDNDDSRNELE